MTTLSAERIIIAAQILVACAITWALLELVRNFIGRPAAWVLGVVILSLVGFALFRWRKKV